MLYLNVLNFWVAVNGRSTICSFKSDYIFQGRLPVSGEFKECKSILSGLNNLLPASNAKYPLWQIVVEGQDRRYIHMFGANRAFTVKRINCDWLAGLKVFYLGGLLAMPGIEMDELLDLLQFCQTMGVITVVDVVVPQDASRTDSIKLLLPHIDYFLPNNDEARQITARIHPLDQLHELNASGANTVIITQGAMGTVAARGKEFWQCGVYHMQVIDPSGTGDAFTSGIISGILRDWDMPTTLRYASALGASATQAIGCTDSVFSTAEAESFVRKHSLSVAREPM